MAQYKTRQKKMITDLFAANREKQFTVDEIASALSGKEDAPGKSTVYRLINKLCEDGTVKRFIKDGSRTAAYQLAGGEECHAHLHLKCLECGRLLHMENKDTEALIGTVMQSSGFTVNRETTMLFGRCGECSAKPAEGHKRGK